MSTQPTDPARKEKKKSNKMEMPATFLPEGNEHARRAYICAIIGMMPVVGIVLGPAGFVFGWLGYRAAHRSCGGKGLGHAVVSMILGGLETIANAVGLPLVARGLGLI